LFLKDFITGILSEPAPKEDFIKPPSQGIRRLFDVVRRDFLKIVLLNLLFLLFCIPLFTIPAAVTAMSKVTMTMFKNPCYYLWEEFITAFKKEFWKATLAGILYYGAISLVLVAFKVYENMALNTPLLYIAVAFSAVCLLLLIFSGFYLFPTIANLNISLFASIKNSVSLAVLCPLRNSVTLVSILVLCLVLENVLPMSLLLVLLIVPAIFNLITTYCASKGIEKYQLGKIEIVSEKQGT